jgi:ATP-dependent protease ClpP protease subunit
MLLDKGIGKIEDDTDPFIYGSAFAEEMYYWKSQGKQITVKINCPGGAIFDGWSMIDAIRETDASTENVGMAYSMGGICLLFGKKRTAYDYATAMIHAPRGGNKQLLEIIRGQFKELLEKRTKFTDAEIKNMMDSGKDFFFNAQEMLEKGIVDEIIATGKSKPSADLSVKKLHTIYNSFIEKPNQEDMDFKAILAKLTGKESEAEGIVAVTEMKNQVEAQKATITAKETEIADLKAKLKKAEDESKAASEKTKAVDLVNAAEKEGKLKFKTPEDKAKMIEDATVNFELFKRMIDTMPVQVKKTVAAATIPSTEGKEKILSYEYLAKNDPKELARLYEDDRELFDKLSDEYNAKMREQNAE